MVLDQLIEPDDVRHLIDRPVMSADGHADASGTIELDHPMSGVAAAVADPPDEARRQLLRISRELHDVVGQDLTAIHLSLMAARRATNPAETSEWLDVGLGLTASALDDVRSLASSLRPPILGNEGLQPALRRYLTGLEPTSGVKLELRAGRIGRLASHVEVAAYRIVQEAVTNALRHGHPRRIDVRLSRTDGFLHVRIVDDGVGFDVLEAFASPSSLGLTGMCERAALSGGWIELKSGPSRGTRVSARFPATTNR